MSKFQKPLVIGAIVLGLALAALKLASAAECDLSVTDARSAAKEHDFSWVEMPKEATDIAVKLAELPPEDGPYAGYDARTPSLEEVDVVAIAKDGCVLTVGRVPRWAVDAWLEGQ